MRLNAARARLLEGHGVDLTFARSLTRRFRGLNLVEIGSEGRAYAWAGGSPCADIWRMSIEQNEARLIGLGFASEGELAEFSAMMADPSVTATSALMMATWGRRAA